MDSTRKDLLWNITLLVSASAHRRWRDTSSQSRAWIFKIHWDYVSCHICSVLSHSVNWVQNLRRQVAQRIHHISQTTQIKDIKIIQLHRHRSHLINSQIKACSCTTHHMSHRRDHRYHTSIRHFHIRRNILRRATARSAHRQRAQWIQPWIIQQLQQRRQRRPHKMPNSRPKSRNSLSTPIWRAIRVIDWWEITIMPISWLAVEIRVTTITTTTAQNHIDLGIPRWHTKKFYLETIRNIWVSLLQRT